MNSTNYHPLRNQELCSCHNSSPRAKSSSRWMTIINTCLLAVSISILMLAMLGVNYRDANWVLQQSTFYSPIFDRYRIAFERKVVQGTLFNEKTLPVTDILLRSYPSPEVDAAWDALTHVGIVTITSTEVSRLGKDPKQAVKAPSEWRFGNDAYLAQMDGQHALHCLNAVRRYAYREHYFPDWNTSIVEGASSSRLFHQAHLSHCLHILLQTLTCNPSMDVITHNWIATQEYPFPDFAINKKCIDHGQLLSWQSSNELSEDEWMEIARRGPATGEHIKPIAEQFREWALGEDATIPHFRT